MMIKCLCSSAVERLVEAQRVGGSTPLRDTKVLALAAAEDIVPSALPAAVPLMGDDLRSRWVPIPSSEV